MRKFCVRAGGLSFGAVARDERIRFRLTESLLKFEIEPDGECDLAFDVLVRDGVGFSPARVLLDAPGAYGIGQEPDGRYVIRGWAQPSPPCVAEVDAGFRHGTVYVPQTWVQRAGGFYPLQTIDTIITVNRLALSGALIVHSAGVSDAGEGYLFVGPSGAGKSTMATLWAGVPGAVVLGEDQTILLWHEAKCWVYGSPWHLRAEMCDPSGVPLRAVFVLHHGARNSARVCSRVEGVASISTNCSLPLYQRTGMEAILATLDALSDAVPIYWLAFRPDIEVVQFVRDTIRGG